MEDAIQYSHHKCDDLLMTVQKHKQALVAASCGITIVDVLSNLVAEIRTQYTPIHIFRPVKQSLMSLNMNMGFGSLGTFADMYRYN